MLSRRLAAWPTRIGSFGLCLFLAVAVASGQSKPVAKNKPAGDNKNQSVKPATPADGKTAKGAKPGPPSRASNRPVEPVVAAINSQWRAALDAAKITPADDADDAEFLRRACLDLTGRIPSYNRTTQFLADTSPDKRRQLIDELLASREFGLYFGERWRNLIWPRDTGSSKQSADRVTPWLAERFQANEPWSTIVADLLTSDANMAREPQAVFMLANSTEFEPRPNLLTASTGKFFLGVHVACAECHNHPYAEWTQEDFWGLAAFFNRVHKVSKSDFSLTEDSRTSESEIGPPTITAPEGAGKATGKVFPAKFLGGQTLATATSPSLRRELANWLTAPDNPYFAKASVNRLWAHFFVRGFVNPIDDFRAGNPPSHPELLQLLSREFAASEFDVKHLVRCICLSDAYGRTSRPTGDDDHDVRQFHRMPVKALSPEALYDSLSVLYGTRIILSSPGGKKPGIASETPELGGREDWIRSFRRSAEEGREDQFTFGIPHLLRLMNAPQFNEPMPCVGDQLAAGAEPRTIVETLYLAALSRRPTDVEIERMLELVGDRPTDPAAYADVQWVLVNSGEFTLNR